MAVTPPIKDPLAHATGYAIKSSWGEIHMNTVERTGEGAKFAWVRQIAEIGSGNISEDALRTLWEAMSEEQGVKCIKIAVDEKAE